MMQQRLIVDMDGVLADIYPQYLKFLSSESDIRLSVDELKGRSEAEVFKNIRKYLFTPGFFRGAPVVRGSYDALIMLNSRYELFVVSSATEFPHSLMEKYEWLKGHFPFITWQQMVFCGLKSVVRGDIMIDDHFKNLDHFKGKTILFTQPHNEGLPDKNHTRVHSWEEILSLLL
jgi:5'(3')-deoxyribonucleotidase